MEFSKAGEATEEEVETAFIHATELVDELEFRATLNNEADALSAELEINAGAGGTEACDWVDILQRMYMMWAERKGFGVQLLHQVEGDVAGYKSITFAITGDFVYGLLRNENGVHRLVRISPFNAQGKRQTSFASVFVRPIVDDSIEINISPADLRVDTFRSSGAGGQHVNKTESAIRITHIPTGIAVECQQERSQIQNRERAMQMLRSRLYDLELKKRNELRDKEEAGKMNIEWGSQIRSYVLDDRRVKDHRSNFQNNNTDAVLNGDLDGFIKAMLLHGTHGEDEA